MSDPTPGEILADWLASREDEPATDPADETPLPPAARAPRPDPSQGAGTAERGPAYDFAAWLTRPGFDEIPGARFHHPHR